MRLLLALTVACLATPPVLAQGIMESGAVRGLSAGLGAGLAGSLGHGAIVRQSYEASVEAQKVIAEQTKAINDYAVRGAQFETQKQWAYAEMAYKYVLALISHRDGPGSPNSVPVLAHLSKISKAQNKLDDAISYQKTVVALTEASKKSEAKAVLSAQRELSGLFIQKHDYAAAKNALQAEVALFDQYPTLPRQELTVSMEVYGKVLQRLGEAAVPPAAAVGSSPYNETAPATTATVGTTGTTAFPSLEPSVVNVAHAGEPVRSPVTGSGAETTGTNDSPASTPAEQKYLEEPRPETPTADQEELRKAHLFGSDPLPSEVELRHELFGTPAPDQTSPPATATETKVPSDSSAK